MKIDLENKSRFMDKEDEAVYRRLLSSLLKKGITKFRMTIELIEENISEKQYKLFKVLVNRVSSFTGQDPQTIEATLLSNFSENKDVNTFTNKEFQDFIESASAFCVDFFSISVDFDKNGLMEIKQI